MTLKPSNDGGSLPKAPCEKAAFVVFIRRLLDLQPDCSTLDLDNPVHQHDTPAGADLAIWLDTWHVLVDALGSSDDAEVGIRAARNMLFDISKQFKGMLFSADTTKPPLDQFGSPSKSLELLFRESTCYSSIVPIATYRGRKVYWGSQPTNAMLQKVSKF